MSRARATVVAGTTLGALAAAACAEVEGGPSAVVALGFDTSTAVVVAGDTLRDTLGQLLPLRAVAYGATGDSIPQPAAPIAYVLAPGDTADTAASVRLAGALVVGLRTRTTPARVFAVAGGLQSLPKSVDVVRRPNRLVAVVPRDSAVYVAGAQSVVGTAGSQLRVTADPADTAAGVPRVAVRFAVERAAPRIADSVTIVDERAVTPTLTPTSPLDTTDARGVVGRRAYVYLKPGAAAVDTVVLRAVAAHPARFRSPTLASDTVRVVVVVRRQAAP